MRVFDGQEGKQVALALGTSEPTVSRRLAKVRDLLRGRLREVVVMYSFTEEERTEVEGHGLTKSDDALFDEAIAEIYHRQQELRRQDQAAAMDK
jgi:hypothetical protein